MVRRPLRLARLAHQTKYLGQEAEITCQLQYAANAEKCGARCRAAYDKLRAKGVEFIQEPIARFAGVDANFRDPSGNAWKMIEAPS